MKKFNLKSGFLASLAASVIISGCNTNTSSFAPSINELMTASDFTDSNSAILASNVFTEADKKGANTNENVTLPSTNDAGSIEAFVVSSYRKIFNEYDKNKNGMIDASELPEAPKAFADMDKDKNKKLSFTEVSPNSERVKQMTGWIYSFYKGLAKKADTDEDGYISQKEIQDSKDLEVFNDLNYWDSANNVMKKNTKAKGINYQQFSIFMNNNFLELSKKYTNYKNPSVNKNGKLPVVLVQGYAEPSWFFMYGIYRDLRKNNWQGLYPVNLFPNITDITEQAKIVAKVIDKAKKEQKTTKVDYVCHSMGGLIGRYYMQSMDGAKNIEHYVSISTPHYGTYIAWAGIGEAAKQMRPGSEFLKDLNNNGKQILPNIKYTSIWTKTDEIVVPAENAILQGSRVMPEVKGVGHLLILWADDTYQQIKDALTDQL